MASTPMDKGFIGPRPIFGWIRFENAAWNRHPGGVMQVDVFGGQPARYLGRSGFLDRFKAQNFSYVDGAAAGQWSWRLEWYHRGSESGELVPGDWAPGI